GCRCPAPARPAPSGSARPGYGSSVRRDPAGRAPPGCARPRCAVRRAIPPSTCSAAGRRRSAARSGRRGSGWRGWACRFSGFFVMEAMLSQNGWLAGIWALTRRAKFVRPIGLASGRTSSALRFATCSVEPNSFGHNADRSGLASAIAAVFRYPSPPLRYPLPLLRFSMLHTIKQNWFANVRGDVLSGLVVALALIPEAIAFSIIAGVDPRVGLYASFCIAVVIAFVGGRPGMISAATGAMALLMVTLVREHGLQYLLAATLLCGVLQIGAGY